MLEGTLNKWTNVMKGWQYRWFVLDENAGLLSYYTSKEKMMKGVRRGCVRLKGAVIGIEDQEDNTFTITVDHKTFHFQARDSDEREKWVRRLEDTIRRHVTRNRAWDGQSSSCAMQQNSSKRSIHLELLDRRVSEADAYLQLMIEQTSKVENKILEMEDPDERAKCKPIQDNANSMLDHIKHSIVLLQIAKNTAHPINGFYQGPSIKSSDNKADKSADEDDEDEVLTSPQIAPIIPNSLVELGSECLEGSRKGLPIAGSANAMSLIVPETSYSSSEGEEDFYDANDDLFVSQGSSPVANNRTLVGTESIDQPQNTPPIIPHSSEQLPDDASSAQTLAGRPKPRNSIPFRSDGSLDYDALYEDEDDTDLSMESHGSVVTHLLSQVKIGMDLTKVVLPTFILERRSLLEMYADYFAHPDLFLKIADCDDPRERMIQVCRWYVSAYHAGRKSTVAKKPYNPILGEIFQCYWETPGKNLDTDQVPDGPVPWCKKDQLTFLAEQVSHHPPISAFYAEHVNKKISFSAHVWTKSKFLGLSIGVHNIGQGIVTLCDLNEEYILTFPNGYARSILTVPWIELGGTVTIQSPQTGYHAEIEFLTKPFYGGKRNKISAEVFAPNEKKPFVTISGEWSGVMEAKWHDSSNPNGVFVDVNSIPIFKKHVRPISEQADLESRKVWKEVTAGLKLNDIDRATNAKYEVEQRQRDENKARKEAGSDWDTKYFKPLGDAWIYVNPLSQRLYVQEKQNKR
ncbi:unnamed protein product [Hermetia illucens]|uniref:Oxysterol-binding protein n=2 Tax=Hermetia illucens TaxID=343691 RepID=A0A7R8UAS6_HERIL|nr:unnamed protein product [Hermetia illucens]